MEQNDKGSKSLTHEQVNQIAGELESGMKCFWDRMNNELLFVPDLDQFPDGEEFFTDEFEKLIHPNSRFVEIENMQSDYAYRMMAEFTEHLTDNRVKFQLQDILSSAKPFKKFKLFIDRGSDNYRNQWFAFKTEKYREWVMLQDSKH